MVIDYNYDNITLSYSMYCKNQIFSVCIVNNRLLCISKDYIISFIYIVQYNSVKG